MGKEIVTFGNTEIEKYIFHHYKNPIFLEDMDINNILISNKTPVSKRNYEYFIDYMDDDYKIKPCFQNKRVHIKSYDGETKWMHFSIEDNELLKNIMSRKHRQTRRCCIMC